jgi:hypothetical protein
MNGFDNYLWREWSSMWPAAPSLFVCSLTAVPNAAAESANEPINNLYPPTTNFSPTTTTGQFDKLQHSSARLCFDLN